MKGRALVLLFALLLALPARAQDTADDDASPERLVASIRVLQREVRELRARVARLEAQLANVGHVSSAVAVTKPSIDPALGFVVPHLPGGDLGADSPGELARFLHHATTSGAHDIERLVAFSKSDFYLPEALWTQAAAGVETLAGLPTRAELDLALGAMREAGASSRVQSILPVPELGSGPIRVVDLVVRHDGRSDRFRMTAALVGGRWLAVHLLATSAEEDARAFVEDLIASQRSFKAFKTNRFAKSLHELAAAQKELEASENLKLAGLTFPLGARLAGLSREKLAWANGELRGPFYRMRLIGDDSGGYVVEAIPESPSYRSFTAAVPGTARVGDPVVVKQKRLGSAVEPARSESEREAKRRDGERE